VSEQAPLFLDRSLGAVVVAVALREAGESVRVHDDHFAQDAPDEEWLPEVARRGWIAVTKDNAIRRGFLQRLAVAQAGASLFVFTPGNMTGQEMAAALAAAAPRIRLIASVQTAPFIATIQASGRVVVWRDRDALLEELQMAVGGHPRRR